jgi:DNA-binding CsgD family transcriptional regulator
MYLFQRVLLRMQSWFRRKERHNFAMDVHTLRSLQDIAVSEQRTPEDVAKQILDDVLRMHQAQGVYWAGWESLTPREKEITALICLNYTTRQIATKLVISPETVKTHVEHILQKFGMTDRNTLRRALSGWDFDNWDH